MSALPAIHICLIHPPGYAHGDALLDPAIYFQFQFQRFGAEVSMERNQLRHGAVNLVFGAHLGFDIRLCQAYSCIFVNLEQLGREGARLPAAYLQLLRNSAVIDYDPANPPQCSDYPDDIPITSFQYAPYMAQDDVAPLEQRPIDLLFFGSMNERRAGLLKRIEACGRRVMVAPFPLYGAERDALIREAKAVVNVPFYESARFEQVRAFLCQSLGTPVLSERRAASQPPAAYEDSIGWFDEQDLERLFGQDFGTPDFYARLYAQLERFRQTDPVEQYADALGFAAGLWQVHSQGAIGQTAQDLALGFGAAPGGAAPLLPNRPGRKPAPLFQYLDDAADKAGRQIDAGRHDEALNIIALAVHQHFCLPGVAHHGLYYPDFDRQIERLTRALGTKPGAASSRAEPADVTLIVATELFQVGGHTKVLEDIARAVKRPVIVLTDLFSTYQNDGPKMRWIRERFEGIEVICLSEPTLWDKSRALARIAAGLPLAQIVYLQHHQDPVAFVGTLWHPSAGKTLIHHCDHNPSLGCTLAGVAHADLSEMLAQTCGGQLEQPVQLLPLYVADQGCRPLPAAGQRRSVVTSGRPGKFVQTGEFALHKIVTAALSAVDGEFYFIGPLDDSWIAFVRSQLRAQHIDPARFVPLGLVPSLWQALLALPDAAFYIGSAPVGGGRAAIEAQGAGLPVLFFSGMEAGSLVENFSVYAGRELGWAGPEQLAALLREHSAAAAAPAQQARAYYDAQFSWPQFRRQLEALLGAAAMA
ncbi:hypothetical protein [Roseateles cavernae]|uniref:hypothetical protein n=1 Tax=Roseateles cavernae TaxID=3153578 RepID=UPI0032E41A9C